MHYVLPLLNKNHIYCLVSDIQRCTYYYKLSARLFMIPSQRRCICTSYNICTQDCSSRFTFYNCYHHKLTNALCNSLKIRLEHQNDQRLSKRHPTSTMASCHFQLGASSSSSLPSARHCVWIIENSGFCSGGVSGGLCNISSSRQSG